MRPSPFNKKPAKDVPGHHLIVAMEGTSTAIVKVTPICGTKQDWAPACYLLEVDNAKVLLDAGTTNAFDMSHFALLRKLTKSIDLILLSHGDLKNCGGLSHVLSIMEFSGPILATLPVHHLGLVTCYDAYQSHYQATGTPPPTVTLDELDAAFERITTLRYSQSYTVPSGNAMGIQVTPIAAGHTLGGAIWRIRKHTEEIFYSMDFNHKREGHLDGAALELVQKPSLLIADAQGALEVHMARKNRDTELVTSLVNTLKTGGTVLLPVDTAGRSLELLQTIETHWNSARLSYPVIFLSHQSRRVVDLARGMLEWMSGSLTKMFEHDRANPFDLQHIQMMHSIEQLKQIMGPKVILATQESLEGGMAKVLLSEVASSPNSSIIFTIKSNFDSLASKIIKSSKGSKMELSWSEEVPLEGEELQEYQREAQEAMERRAAEAAFAQLQREREENEEEGDIIDKAYVKAGGANISTKQLEQEQIASAVALQHVYWTDYKHDWFVDTPACSNGVDERINSPYYPLIPPDASMRVDGAPNRYQCFPFRELRRIVDKYGEAVDFENSFIDPLIARREAMVPSISALSINEPKALQIIAPLNNQQFRKDKPPMKWIMQSKHIYLKCTVKFIDFSGVSDGRSLKTIYSRIGARRLVLAGGSTEAIEYLANHFMQSAVHSGTNMDVYTPSVGETVTVCSAVNVIPALLSETLISRLNVQLLGEYEVAWIRGILSLADDVMEVDQPLPVADEAEEEENKNEDIVERSMSLVINPPEDQIGPTAPLMLGDPRLSELRRMIMNELRLPASFVSGDLICGQGDRRVAIRKNPNTAELYMEGPLSAEYYSIRQILYSTTVLLS